jgi:hypothetical protein
MRNIAGVAKLRQVPEMLLAVTEVEERTRGGIEALALGQLRARGVVIAALRRFASAPEVLVRRVAIGRARGSRAREHGGGERVNDGGSHRRRSYASPEEGETVRRASSA